MANLLTRTSARRKEKVLLTLLYKSTKNYITQRQLPLLMMWKILSYHMYTIMYALYV